MVQHTSCSGRCMLGNNESGKAAAKIGLVALPQHATMLPEIDKADRAIKRHRQAGSGCRVSPYHTIEHHDAQVAMKAGRGNKRAPHLSVLRHGTSASRHALTAIRQGARPLLLAPPCTQQVTQTRAETRSARAGLVTGLVRRRLNQNTALHYNCHHRSCCSCIRLRPVTSTAITGTKKKHEN